MSAQRHPGGMSSRIGGLLVAWMAVLAAGCGGRGPAQSGDASVPRSQSSPVVAADQRRDDDDHGDHGGHRSLERDDQVAAQLGTAAFQDVGEAEAAGYTSTLDALGCFQDRERGGMGVHFLNDELMDATLDLAHPEALVYELDAHGEIVGLVAHEYIVPVEAWTSSKPPKLDGIPLHRHPTLPLWVLHAWLWKDNPAGMLQDWNPAVRQCPPGVPVFGVDRPAPAAPPVPSTAALRS